MTGALVLPQDIEIVSLAEFPSSVQERIGAGGHEYAVTRPLSRVPSKVIDAPAAALLRQFEKPTTLVEAILRFSKTTNREAAQVLEEVYPFLESCLMAKLLVPPGTDSELIRASFNKGETIIADWEVQECLQVLDDSEFYRIRNGNLAAALKIERLGSGNFVKENLAREAAILKRLNGRIAPRLLSASETEDGRGFLLLEWIPGELCGEAAAVMRARSPEPLSPSLVALCANILDAYTELHDLGVVHSDVHANNVMVTEQGEIRIIDYGLSRLDSDLKLIPRAGVGFFFEPEYARADLSGAEPPLSTFAGEQYSVAALIYFLLTGHHYLDFSYDKQEVLRQIAEQSAVPLVARGLSSAGPLNEVLSHAFSKDAAARFPAMRAMAGAFREGMRYLDLSAPSAGHTRSPEIAAIPVKEDQHLRDWLEAILDRLSVSDADLPVIRQKYPTASLAYGAAGIAYGLFRIACLREDAELGALAERWLDRSNREAKNETGFYHPDVQITPESVGHTSPYHSLSGLACVQALLAHSWGDGHGRAVDTRRFLDLSAKECRSLDLTCGRSGTLLAIATLVDAFRWEDTPELGPLTEAGNKLIVDLWSHFDAMPSILESKSPTYLGMAHGWAGFLYATLRWIMSSQSSCPADCQARLHQLAEKVRWRQSRASWPSQTLPGSPVLGGWCNGSAGFAFLWTLANRMWPDAQWLTLAIGAGTDAFHPREEGLSLCCGLTGKAYSQLNLYKHTGDRHWLGNATTLAKLAVKKAKATGPVGEPRIPLSLYKGDLGLAVLVAELEHPEFSAMPFFEDEAWPAQRFDPHENP